MTTKAMTEGEIIELLFSRIVRNPLVNDKGVRVHRLIAGLNKLHGCESRTYYESN